MKIQLDTTLKIIRIEDTVNLGEFFEILERLLPNGIWKEFRLEVLIINWTNPIIIDPFPYIPYTPQPLWPWWQQPVVTCDSLMNGTYNVEVK
jgi:hypothetical protein